MKSEKEKMLSGELYNCGDSELLKMWHKAKKLTQQYNSHDATDREGMSLIMSQLLGSHGVGLWIAPPFFVDYGENIHIGNNCEINMNCVFLDCNKITIGNNVLIAPSVQIYTVGHPTKPEERFPNLNKDGENIFGMGFTAPVTIGNNVWIGGGTIILPGVTIGDNVTIGAGSVVSKSIPANSLAVGNPCKVIRSIY